MSTQQARNVLNQQIDALIEKAKEEIKKEGKKKINELKQKIPKPQDLAKKLITDINGDTCSAKGQEKFMRIFNSIISKIENVEKIIDSALEKILGIENEIKPIVEGDGPIKKLKDFTEILNNIMVPLNIAVNMAPALLAPFTNQGANAIGSDQVQQKRDKAFSKVKEYTMLVTVVSLMITFYINEAQKVFIPINLAKNKLQFIKDEIMKIKLYLLSLLLRYEGGCTDMLNNQNISTVTPPYPPLNNGPTPLEEYLQLLNQQYNDVYNHLQASGNIQATERIYEIKENLEKGYNISFTTINF